MKNHKKAEAVAVFLIALILIGAFIALFSITSLTGKVISGDPSTKSPIGSERTCISFDENNNEIPCDFETLDKPLNETITNESLGT